MIALDPRLPRLALVTGGSRRLGRAMVLELAALGFDLLLHCRRHDADADAVAAEVRAQGRACRILAADLAREDEVEALSRAAGGIGVLVNNASLFQPGEWHDTRRQDWDAHMEPNLRAPFVLSQGMARSLPPDGRGVIVNMLDQRVWALTPHFMAYTVSKYALWGLTRSLALALAPRIRVNAIGPGPALPSTHQTDAQFAAQCARMPLGHGTGPGEVACALRAVLSLPSMTGQMLALDGGQHLLYGGHTAEVE